MKEVRTSSQESSTQYFIGTDNYLDYTIQFQNTGTDTAFTVVVTDTLDAALDMARFEQGVIPTLARWISCPVVWCVGLSTISCSWIAPPTKQVVTDSPASAFACKSRCCRARSSPITRTSSSDFNEPIRTPDVTVVTETSTGVNASTRKEWVLHPNPSSGTISITGHALVSVNVVDLSGREVYQADASDGCGALRFERVACGGVCGAGACERWCGEHCAIGDAVSEMVLSRMGNSTRLYQVFDTSWGYAALFIKAPLP